MFWFENGKKIIIIVVFIILLAGCSQAERATANLEKEADNFNIHRQVTVINGITDDVIFQITGKCSIENKGKYLYIIIEYDKGKYKRVFAGLSDNVTYLAEDLESVNVSPYWYEININPKMWLPALPDIKD